MTSLRALLTLTAAALFRKRGVLLAFVVGIGMFQYIVTASYPAIGGAAAVENVVRTFPPGLRRLLKIAPNLQAGFGLRDYLALGFFHPVFLGFGSAFVVGRAADGLAGAIERGAIYLLLSRPVPRWTLVLSVMLEIVIGTGALALAGWLGVALGIWTTALPEAVSPAQYGLPALMAWLLFMALGAGALIIASWTSRSGLAAGVGSAWTLISFVLDVLPAVAESPLAVLNPWHHYDPQAIVALGRIDPTGLIVLLSWIVLGTLLACVLFAQRDLV